MLVLFADFESYYSTEYSLTRIDPASYILDPRFETICLGMANLANPPILFDGPDVPSFFKSLKRQQAGGLIICMVTHNAQFDVAIMNWRYDFRPDFIVDTIALSRTWFGPLLKSHSLDSVAAHLGLPAKGSVIKEVKGMRRADIIAAGLWPREVEYCLHDTWLCREVYKNLLPNFTTDELILHDIITRCTTQPVLRIDKVMLGSHLGDVMTEKQRVLEAVSAMGVTKADLMSNPKFALVLQGLGVVPPKKISPSTGESTYAFAKGDEEFVELLEHPNPMVRSVVEARLETKSTIEETRTRRFLQIASLPFPGSGECTMPMPVVIGAAHTHRVGGGWDLNVQNLGRGSKLRHALYADEGYVLMVGDSRQIEARTNAWFCDQTDLVEQFARGEDVYANFATEIYGYPVTKANIPERFTGKTGILQLGYASGWRKFQVTVANQSRELPTPVVLSDEQAQSVVRTYRWRYARIPATWRVLDNVLTMMIRSADPYYAQMKCIRFETETLWGPTGLPIRFPRLAQFIDPETGMMQWVFDGGRYMRRTYGASLLETICQHISRCIVFGAAVRLREPMARLGARLVHSAHDELAYMVPVIQVESAKIWLELEMNRVPSWAPGLPLACEIGVATRYGDAK